MRTLFLIIAVVCAAILLTLWVTGGFDHLSAWASASQREFQNQMASSLRALRAGDPGALATLMTVCFAYGFFHAIGPGHGKVLIGGYGLGSRVAMWRLSGIALLSSLAQGLSAILLVYAGVTVLGLTRKQMVNSAENIFAPASYGAIALVGIWLVIRGVRKIRKTRHIHPETNDHNHSSHDHTNHDHTDHDHSGHDHSNHDATCDHCGHRHGPTLEESQNVHSLRDLILLVGAIAIRPCTGALFLLILTWRFGIAGAGIAGTLAMALGTASVTILVAIAATGLRESTLRGFTGETAQKVVPVLEIIAGVIVAVLAFQLLRVSL